MSDREARGRLPADGGSDEAPEDSKDFDALDGEEEIDDDLFDGGPFEEDEEDSEIEESKEFPWLSLDDDLDDDDDD